MNQLLWLWLLLLLYNVVDCNKVFTTYHWHMQQPIYWPAKSQSTPNTYQKAYESEQLQQSQGNHPDSDLHSIFSKADRQNDYTGNYPINAIKSVANNAKNMGAQVSYSGCLIENINSLAEHNTDGYQVGWNQSYASALNNLKTADGKHRRLDLVSFTYHHALGPLIDAKSLEMEIAIHKLIYYKTWNTKEYSKGFFPAEMAFSERMIPSLVKAGIEWVIVPNNHLSRACKDYPYSTSGDNNDPPNQADQMNPSQQNYFSQSISRGCTPNNAYPFSFQPHKAQSIDPTTGEKYEIIVVPAAMAMSWQDSCACYGTSDIDKLSNASPSDHPMLFLFAHDGDNYFAGGYSYYMQCVPSFVNEALNNGYEPTTIQGYLDEYPVDPNDIIHVEDGAWVNADGDFGAPQCLNWNWPLVANNSKPGEFDIPNGWALKERNWAIITAAQNHVLTAEQIQGHINIENVQDPSSTSTNAELAWHFFLPALTSGYMYYGAVDDMPVKQTVACNIAVDYAQQVINQSNAKDTTSPSVWTLQRLPWNPGGIGAGSLYGYKPTNMSEDFYIWTFVYDVSGLKSVTLMVRTDNDGINPLDDDANELYEPEQFGYKDSVSSWTPYTMKQRVFPKNNIFDENIDLTCDASKKPCLPSVIADEYYIQLQGYSKQYLDYYVEAMDIYGNTKKTPIYHVYVN